MKLKKITNLVPLVLLERGTKYTQKQIWRESVKQRLKEWPCWDPRDPSYKQSPKPDTIVDANKSLLGGAWYSCLLRGSASAWQIWKWMLTTIHWMEHRESIQGAEGVCSPIAGTTIWSNQYLQSSPGRNYQPKKTHGGTHGSSCICSRGWPWLSSMGGEALGPVKVLCPSTGEFQG